MNWEQEFRERLRRKREYEKQKRRDLYLLDDLRDDYETLVHNANVRHLETLYYLGDHLG